MSDSFQDSDFSAWGIAALVSGAIAVFSANVAGYIPDNILAGLHTTRLQSGNINQISSHLDQLRSDTRKISRDYRMLLSRFELLHDDSGETVRRLAAVEISLPLLIESLPLNSDIDRSILTASIAAAANEVFEVEGGTMVVRRTSLFGSPEGNHDRPVADQPLPAPLDSVTEGPLPQTSEIPRTVTPMQGIAIGDVVAESAATDEWEAILSQAGPLLLGTAPLLGQSGDGGRTRIIAGPLPDSASADALCTRLGRVEIACDPTLYEGRAWPN